MNRDFKDCLFYYDKLSVALNAIALGELLWIYQEDSEKIFRYFVYTLRDAFGSLEHELVWIV